MRFTIKYKLKDGKILEDMFSQFFSIAKTKGFVYVLDSKALIVSEGEDLGPAVKTKLGIQ